MANRTVNRRTERGDCRLVAMTDDNSGDDTADLTRTTIELDREVWREVRSDAVADGANVSEKLEEVLVDYYNLE